MIALILFKQIVVLFIMIALGYLVVKLGLLKSEDSKVLSVITVYLVLPCTLFNAFQIDYTSEIRDGFLLAFSAVVLIHIFLFSLGYILTKVFSLTNVEKCSLIYTNAGNLMIPIIIGVLGHEWVIYLSAFLIFQCITVWTHGLSVMMGKRSIAWKSILLNVNIIASLIGMVTFLLDLKVPEIASSVISSMASIVGPLSMLMLGMLIARMDLKKVFLGKRIYLIAFLRLIFIPLIMLVLLKYSGLATLVPNGDVILMVCLLAVSAPAATTITQQAQLYGHDAPYASAINVLSTLACIASLPVIVYLYVL